VNEQKLDRLREVVDGQLKGLREDNSAKLEQMRATVDEKLHATLEQRLGESFKQVSERLEQVHKGLGEMQSLATGVGDLKKVLSNVKTRGTFGEIQLGSLLEQILAPEQYATNVATRPGSSERVEFAIKLPGRDPLDRGEVWLPLDAKFPQEDYLRLVEAQEQGNPEAVADAARQLERQVKLMAAAIRDKYLDPPHTTDFGLMFLPTEGLYAEVLRRPGLCEQLQREFRVIVTGPTTLAALLNSLQMGFRTLVIEKRSSEVWKLLGAVKTEFGKFGDILEKTKKKLDEASNSIDTAAVRTRAIERKLRTVEQLPTGEAAHLLETDGGLPAGHEEP
jgi:DNA recombination protein RmuC